MPGTGFYELCDHASAGGGKSYLLAGDEWAECGGRGEQFRARAGDGIGAESQPESAQQHHRYFSVGLLESF